MMLDDEQDFRETRLGGEVVFRGAVVTVEQDRVRLPDGSDAVRDVVRHPGAAAIVPLLDANTVVLERQFRYPVGRVVWEIPAGKIDAGESPLATARRELLEETGYQAEDWREMMSIVTCVGFCDEQITLYLAQNLRYQGHNRDVGELMEIKALPLSVVWDMLARGEINDAKTVIGLLRLKDGGLV